MVDKIRELCRQNGTSIKQLEKDLGFGNGVIARWSKSKPSYERLAKVALALNVSVSDLAGEEQIEKPTHEIVNGPNRAAFYAALEDMNHDQLLEALQAVTDKLKEKQGK